MKTGLITFLILLVVPTMALAACSANSNVWNPSILKGPLITCTGTGSNGTQQCQNLCDLACTFINIVYYFIGVVIWIVTPIMIAIGGIWMMFSQGNPGQLESAKKMIRGTVIGLLIVLCAYLIIYTFVSVLGINLIGGFSSSTVDNATGANVTPACSL